jgi:hypothetical protein
MSQDELTRVAEDLKFKANVYRTVHYGASNHLRIIHYALGLLLIIVSAVVSGSVLQAGDGSPSTTLKVVAGSLSVSVVVLTAIQTTFKLGERSEQHRSAGAAFGRIARALEVFIHRPHADVQAAWDELLKIGDEIANVEAGAPGFLQHTYERAKREVEAEHAQPAS